MSSSETYSLQHVLPLSLLADMPKISCMRHPGSIKFRCLNRLIWVRSMKRSTGSTFSPSGLAQANRLRLLLFATLFFHHPELVAVAEGRLIDQPVNLQLHLLSPSYRSLPQHISTASTLQQ